MATHCTQFSREQRFDSIQEVKSLLTKSTFALKTILLILAIAIVVLAAIIFVPKIIGHSKTEPEPQKVELNQQPENPVVETTKVMNDTNAFNKERQLDSIKPVSDTVPTTANPLN